MSVAVAGRKKAVVTIDGASAVGTTKLSRGIAQRFGFTQLNTGALYRGLTMAVLEAGIKIGFDTGVAPQDHPLVVEIANAIFYDFADGSVVKVNGSPVTPEQLQEVGRMVHHVAHLDGVREPIRVIQHAIAAENDTVAEGRDLGSVVFPSADLKLFLVCDDEERARRRSNDLGRVVTIEELRDRDRMDEERENCPFVKPDGAHVLDTTTSSVAELVRSVEFLMRGVPSIHDILRRTGN